MSNPPGAMPHSLDAERATLGAVLMNRDALPAVSHWLTPEDFYDERHGWIYEAMQSLLAGRVSPDVRTVADDLTRRGRLDSIGGAPYLLALPDYCPASTNIEHYAREVARTSLQRRLVAAGAAIARIGYDQSGEIETAISAAYTTLDSATSRADDAELQPLARTVDDLYAAMEAGGRPGTPTGFYDYDRATGGLHRKKLVIIGARPSVGKSALALCLARALATAGGHVLIFSLEMTRAECVDRLVAMLTGINSEDIRDRTLEPDDLTAYVGALGRVAEWPIWIDETAGLSIEAIRAKTLRHIAERGPVAAVIVDHIQLVTAPPMVKEYEVVTQVSKKLKELAKQADTTVIGLSQLNRDTENRTNKRPTLADLRATGAIEQDADQVLLLYREELYEATETNKGQAEMIIAKHRDGRLDTINLLFHGPTTEFRNKASYRGVTGY